MLRGGLLFFGLVAAVLVFLYVAARLRTRAAVVPVDAIDQTIAAAEASLARSRTAAEARLGRQPLALFLGPAGSTKSSVITHSGLEPELLAGEVLRGDAVVPTDPANVWYAQGTLLVEAGGRLLDDPGRWTRFTAHLRPSRLAAALGRGAQAPRLAVVCYGCDEFLKPGASDAVPTAARTLRARLGEVARQLGIRLPVYVLFTKADRLPYFADYVRSMTPDEAQQVLGATLPVNSDTGGAWAERESRRLQEAFGRIVHALSLRRLDVLPREVQDEVRAGAYEFPRELRKIGDLAVQFLIDVGRPSQLEVSPLLRGFYFTGVRPVILRDVVVDAVRAMPQAPPVSAGATSVFDPRTLQPAAAAAPLGTPGGRKVPQWVFLRRLFRDVILADDVAFRMTRGGTRVDMLRRSLIAGAAAACLVLALGFTVSYAGNRGMVRDATRAAAAVRHVGGVPGTLGEEDLARLDTLRVHTAELARYQREGRPLRLAWGLYAGEAAEPLLRKLYFDRFEVALWGETRGRLVQYLRALPRRPTEDSDFGRAQDALAAHLLTTSQHRRSTREMLAPVLMSYWQRPGQPEDSIRALARRQFEFFATELAYQNPYEGLPDTQLVARTQEFLRAFGMEAYYRALVNEASRGGQPVRFLSNRSAVRNDAEVPAAFTTAGWRYVRTNLDSVEQLFARYEWIYGSQPPANKPNREELARMYQDEYVRRWHDYLGRGSVERFASISDAATRLAVLGASNSPLFGMLALASRETALDSTSPITQAFLPLHATVAPDADPRAATASVIGYTSALNALSTQLTQLASAAGPTRDPMLMQASAAAAEVKREAGTLGTAVNMTGAAALTANQIQRLLQQPANHAGSVLSGLPAADLNQAGRAFCSSFQSVGTRYPFNPRASADASIDDVNAMLQKDEGLLWSFYEDVLQPLLTPRGQRRPAARVRSDFASFFARAAEVSNALYRSGTLSVAFHFQPEVPAGASEVLLQVDGSEAVYSPTSRASRMFEWEAERAGEARLIAVFGDERVTVASGQGPWAVFRLFHAARWTSADRAEWRVPGRGATLVGQVSFETGVPAVFRPGYLTPLSQCRSQIAN
ncbi:MAG TPA: type VI secretion protein IcmF/TssM N-terminal domain-containing protein [Longimicrobiales bacterium]|nr:type VI secretion protein IcmF/TssM N-terminal domain-containing protein [Longimicrobiales bacterium]